MSANGVPHRVLTPAEKADRRNRERLGMCGGHQFRAEAEGDRWTCARCGGVVTTEQQFWYRTGWQDGFAGRE